MKIIISVSLIFVAAFSVAQTKTSISGVIKSEGQNKGIEYAHVFLKNGTVGTYSNIQGQFTFNIPDSLASDTLKISRIGYHNYDLSLSKIDFNDTLKIFLQESALNLKEVVIHDHRDSVTAIIERVLKKIRKNYPTKLHYLEGFYRQLSLKGDTYTRLIEASIGVTENSYMKERTTSKVKIRQLRKSEDYREYSLKLKMLNAATHKMGKTLWGMEFDNSIYSLLKINYPKVNKQEITIWSKDHNFIEIFDFEITDVTQVDSSTLYYHIKFQLPPDSSDAFAYYGGEMVINMTDYAIIEWTYGMTKHPYKTFPAQKRSLFFKDKYFYKDHVIYSKVGNKYFPTFFERLSPAGGGTTSHIDKETGKKRLQYSKVTFMVNRVVARKKEFDRIKRRDELDNEVNIYEMDHQYDSTFWNNYNILIFDPLLKSAKDDLEKEETLKKQFEKNGE